MVRHLHLYTTMKRGTSSVWNRWRIVLLSGFLVGACDGSITGGSGGTDGGSNANPDAGSVTPIAVSTIAELGVPFDVNVHDLVGPEQHSAMYGKPPEIIARPDGTAIDVLWQDRSNETAPKAFLIRLEADGDDYVVTRALSVPTLDRIMGLDRDTEGNYYVATGLVESLHREITVDYPAEGEYRSGIVDLRKFNSDGDTLFTTDVDTARQATGEDPELVINPMVAASSRLAFGGGSVALVHGINTDPDSGGTRHQKALTTHFDASSGSVTKTSSMWVSHSFDERVFHDGQGFVEMHLGDAYPRSIAFSRVEPNSGTYHLFHIKGDLGANNTRTRLGNVVMLDGSVDHGPWGYLAVIATERTTGTDPVGSASRIAGSRDLALIRVRASFEANDRATMDHVEQAGVATQAVTASGDARTNYVRWLTDYHVSSPGAAHVERPKLVAIGNDRYALLWERWQLNTQNDRVEFDATYAMIIDGAGSVVQPATQITTSHLPRGDDAFAIGNSAAWITGDEATKALHVHIVSDALSYRRVIVE